MTYAENISGAWVIKTPRQFRNERNASIPDANLEAEGLFTVADDTRPDAPGHMIQHGPIVDRDGRPVRTWEVRDPTEAEVKALRADLHRQINAERDRRLIAGAVIDVTGYGPVALQGRPDDRTNLIALERAAERMVTAGVTDPVFEFRDANNDMHDLTPAQMFELASKGMAFAGKIIRAAWPLKDADPIPRDYQADTYWP